MQRLLAIVRLTWKGALRFRLFPVITALLLLAVVALPLVVRDDGTARGFTQILITYTLGAITAVLGLSTLWLACGSLARDIEECQVQLVAVKPIARWQIWLGKWLGIMSLNAVLLALSGACVFVLLEWRAARLPQDEQKILRNEVLVARGSAREPDRQAQIASETDERLRERLRKTSPDDPLLSGAGGGRKTDLRLVEDQIREQVKARYQVVPPGYQHIWKVPLGVARHFLRNKPLYLRVKFNSAEKSPSGTFAGIWGIGVPRKTERLWQSEMMSLAPDTFHEFEIPPNLFDDDGTLTVHFGNPPSNPALIFTLEEGLEVLYPESGFGVNFMRGLGIIFCWLGLLAAVGLAAATFLSFPVAAFLSLALLTVVFSTNILANVIEEGTIMGWDSAQSARGHSPVDPLVVQVFRAVLWLVNLAKNFSPVDSLSTGRSISWAELGTAFAQIVLLLGGLVALAGMAIFSRRELATAQPLQ